jgi:hypothetical protein
VIYFVLVFGAACAVLGWMAGEAHRDRWWSATRKELDDLLGQEDVDDQNW